jgi:hypothetical protein
MTVMEALFTGMGMGWAIAMMGIFVGTWIGRDR